MPQIHFKAGPPVWGADFYGRGNEIRQLQSQMMSSQSTLVTGMRRIGKSSLLHHVHKTSAIWDDHVPRVWLDCLTCVTLDDFANHIEHLVNVMGIDHVGVGNDNCGPGPSTNSMVEFPEDMPQVRGRVGDFDWSGFREEHRVHGDYRLVGYDNFGDWPNLTVKLAERGFNEEELRKILGLNYLRVFRDIVG